MVRDTSTGNGKVVVNRCMSLDGFTAGPGDAMDWVFDFVAPIESAFPEIMAATGAMLIGRRTYEVGKRMADGPHPPAYDGGAEFVLTHDPPDPPDPAVTFLTGDIGEAVATALRAAGGKNLEILGADIRFFSPPGLARIDLEPLDSTRSGAVTILRFRVRK